jgi:hypothetical protein
MPEWDGNERRQSELSSVRAELSTVRDALVHVAEGMESFVSTDEIDRRIEYERRQRTKLTAVIGIGVLVAIVSTFVSIAQLNDLHRRSVANRVANRQSAEFTRAAVNCILYSLNEHRQANEFAHKTIANGIHIDYNEPVALMPKPSSPELSASCDTLNRLVGGKP